MPVVVEYVKSKVRFLNMHTHRLRMGLTLRSPCSSSVTSILLMATTFEVSIST